MMKAVVACICICGPEIALHTQYTSIAKIPVSADDFYVYSLDIVIHSARPRTCLFIYTGRKI